MSTAEQILAGHRAVRVMNGQWRCTGCDWVGPLVEHAAHVVAALTNAGRAIVELPEATSADPDDLDPGDDPRTWIGAHERYWVEGRIVVGEFGMGYTPGQARKEAAALLAAARVAEGGDQP